MNFKKIALTLVCGSVAMAAMGQTGLTSRIFTYDGSVGTNGQATYVLNGDGANAYLFSGSVNGTGNSNAIVGASITNAAFLVNTVVNVSSYVYISGNFAGTYTVTGVGAGMDGLETNQVEVRTNRSLTFTAAGFYPMGASVGTIQYTMSLFQDYPASNVVLAGTGASLIDDNFNGATIGLNAVTQLPPDGRATLQLTRQLTLTQAALGGHSYSAAGTIQVGVN
jgi:hypothetical protein